jgi:type II secretory pathway pseudopilin PulG
MKGQTLIEMVVALGIACIIIIAITAAVISALSGVQFSKNQNLATQYAQEGMEFMHQLRDADYAAFVAKSRNDAYCLGSDRALGADLNTCKTTPNIGTSLIRTVVIKDRDCDNNLTKVSVSVSWRDGKCTDPTKPYCHASSLVQCFSNYNKKAAP